MSASKSRNSNVRHPRAMVSVLGATQLHLRNPFIVAFWSFMFPGLGHLLLSKYILAFLIFTWEIIINVQAHVNEGIFYSFIGRIDLAKQVLDIRWLLLYIPTFFFIVWDSYRTAVDINGTFLLASREDAEIKPSAINALGINYLDRSSPWAAFVWSMLSPGAGQIVIHRIIAAFFLLIWWIVLVYFSKLLPAIHFMMLGRFEDTKTILCPQWFLNVPSLYVFAMYDAYTDSVESNKLYDWEQAKFLKREYQNKRFTMPIKRNRGGTMYIVSSFEHSVNLEAAITAIQMLGVAKEDILAVPLDKMNEQRKLFDTTRTSDSLSSLDIPMVLAAIFCLMGAIYGFILPMGPVLLGIAGMFAGFGLGLLIKMFTSKKYGDRQKDKMASEVMLLIACKKEQMELLQETLWSNAALGVSKLSLGDDA